MNYAIITGNVYTGSNDCSGRTRRASLASDELALATLGAERRNLLRWAQAFWLESAPDSEGSIVGINIESGAIRYFNAASLGL